ncbi:MAG: hypothetical protein AB7D37_19320 [Desulfovibrio sp.]
MTQERESESAELALLRRIDGKVDCLTTRLDAVDKRAAMAGAVSGSVAGGVVAVAINYIRVKMGW